MKDLDKAFWESKEGLTGPTKKGAAELGRIRSKESLLSRGETTLLLTAFEIWNGHGNVTILDILSTLEPDAQNAIGSLIVALSCKQPEEIDRWIHTWEQ